MLTLDHNNTSSSHQNPKIVATLGDCPFNNDIVKPCVRQGHSMIGRILGNQSSSLILEIYISSGRTNSQQTKQSHQRNILNDLWKGQFMMNNNTLDNLASKNWTEFNNLDSKERHNHTSVYFENFNKIVTFGGSNPEEYCDSLCFMDLNSQQLAVENINRPLMQEWPSARHGHTALPYKGKYMIVFGGKTGFGLKENLYKNDLWMLDVENKTWKEIKPKNSPPKSRCWHASQMYKDRFLLVCGGFYTCGRELYLNDLWSFDMETLLWTCLIENSDKKQVNAMRQRNRHGLFLWNDLLFVLGGNYFDGSRDHFLQDIYFVDLTQFKTKTVGERVSWTSITISANDDVGKEFMNEGRGHFTSLILPPSTGETLTSQVHVLLFGGESYKKRHNSFILLTIKQQ